MRIRQPIVWGSVAALLAAAAFAQQPGTSTSQPRQNAGEVARTNDARMYAINGSTDPKSVLGRLEGVWKVEMRINPTQWHHTNSMRGSHGMNHDSMRHDAGSGMTGNQGTTGSTGITPGGVDNNPGTGTPGSNQPNTGDRAGFQAQPSAPTSNPDTPRTGTQPSTGTQPGTTTRSQPTDPANNQTGTGGDPTRTGVHDQTHTAGAGMDHAAMSAGTIVQGYSEKRWIMGDSILQETSVVPDLGTELGRRGGMDPNSNPNRIDNNRDAAGNIVNASQPVRDADGTPSIESYEAGRLFKTMSFLSFNEGTQQFDYVCMDSREGGLKHAAGTYDAGSNRIEFNVTDVMGGGHEMGHSGSTGATGTTGVDANRPYDPTNPRGNMTTPTGTPTSTGAPSSTNPSQPARTNDPNRANDPTHMDHANHNNPNHTNTGMGQPDQRRDWSSTQAMKDDDFRVVVEILSTDQHRVTMYRNAGSESWQERQEWSNLEGTITTPATDVNHPGTTKPEGTPSTGATPRPATGATPRPATGTQPATTPASTPAYNQPRTTTTTQPGSLAWDNSFDSPYGVIVWQATYTRVNGAEAARYRQNLLRADQLMQTTAEVETER